ncbi:hypothetical protein [Streptomyces sp. NPDC048385]|uniref:hypothetical protein n=1 Tax=unclassified Streptomyces TaxID=2593676 RepID=UPI00342C699B
MAEIAAVGAGGPDRPGASDKGVADERGPGDGLGQGVQVGMALEGLTAADRAYQG